MKIVKSHFATLQRIAEDLPESSGGSRIAAMIADGKRVVSFGINRRKTHPFQARFAKNNEAIFLHAEVDALQNAVHSHGKRNLRHMTLYVLRVKRPSAQSKEWILGLARPCEGCRRALAAFDIHQIVYTTDSGELEIL